MLYFFFFFFFFFSSRRRHTRLTCDWSSDVCSSDLQGGLLDRCGLKSSEARARERRGAGRADSGKCERRRSRMRSEEHTSELQSHVNLVCRLLLEKKKD